MSGPATVTSYEESVGSCGPPTPHIPPPSAAPRSAPVRRQLDFTGGGDLEDDDDEFFCRMVDNIERGYSEAKGRAPPCVCGRGACAVERDDQSGRWKYVCPSRPKCNHVAICEKVDFSPKSQLTSRSHPKPTNHYAFNDPSNHVAGPRTPVNVHPQVTVAMTPVNVCPQVVGGTTLFSGSPQGAGVATLVSVSQHGEGTATPANNSPLGVGTTTPSKFIPQGAGPRTPIKVTPQGSRSKDEWPVCQCTAGTCKKSKIGKEYWYICPITKGKGACSYRVLVDDFKAMITSAQATPCDEVHPECPSLLHRPISTVNTPSKSPMRPYGTPSPISPNSNNTCFLRKETGHSKKDCPKQPRSHSDEECFNCGMVGHWRRDCPKL